MNLTAEKKNTAGISGMSIGVVALCVAVLHFWAGPIAPKQPIENVIAEKAVAINDAVAAKLRGEELKAKPIKRSWDADQIVVISSVTLGLLAVILGFVAFVRREDSRISGSAAVLGASDVPPNLSSAAI